MKDCLQGMNDHLKGARILLVGRDYFFYTREILRELRETFGAEVVFVPIEPSGLRYKLYKRLGWGAAWLTKYHVAALASLRGQTFDVVLFIQVHQIGAMISEYRREFAGARFILYYWDSLRTHDYRRYIASFDEVCTFDREDASNNQLRYLPLFYTERFRSLRGRAAYTHDISFVGAAVSMVRYEQLQRFRGWARRNGIALADYVVVSPFLYLKLLTRGEIPRGVHFKALPEAAVMRFYECARCILDLPNNVQSGYTMRTFEALGAHRKLITTNPRIKTEAFYSPQAVFITDGSDFPDKGFLHGAVAGSQAMEQYSLRAWIVRLLCHESRDVMAPMPTEAAQ